MTHLVEILDPARIDGTETTDVGHPFCNEQDR
jgi:hypothetical protein